MITIRGSETNSGFEEANETTKLHFGPQKNMKGFTGSNEVLNEGGK